RAIEALPAGTRLAVAFPSRPDENAPPAEWIAGLKEEGFIRVHVGDRQLRLDDEPFPDNVDWAHVWVIVDRVEAGKTAPERIADSVETAFARGRGRIALRFDATEQVFDRRLICPRCNIPYPEPEPRLFSFDDPLGACPTCQGTGVVSSGKRSRTHESTVCPTCHGSRLNDQALIARIGGRTIDELSALTAAGL